MIQAYYLDSSAVVKIYWNETGSQFMRRLVSEPNNLLFTFHLTRVEFASALWRRLREGTLNRQQLQNLMAALRRDWRSRIDVIELTEAISILAEDLLSRYTLRAYDAVHLASALWLRSEVVESDPIPTHFVCSDGQLNRAAQSEGLSVIDPIAQS